MLSFTMRSSSPTTTKLTRNQFKCFECRQVFAQRDGDWIDWDEIQVHLCSHCEKSTQTRPERLAHRALS